MSSEPISKALDELARARANVKRVTNRQVRGSEDRAALRATALAWFHSHRPTVLAASDPSLLVVVDAAYHFILSGADRNTTTKAYLSAMASAKDGLIRLRAHLVVASVNIADAAPDFSPLTSDSAMKAILERRWIECTKCVSVKAHLAAIVMMGGLLEGLFVARAIQLTDRSALFASSSVPVDRGTGKKVPLGDWMLKTYLLVGHDVGWITRPARDLAEVLGEYRNYVHPEKERRYGALGEQDSAILWDVTKNLVTQLLVSAKPSGAPR